jgi:hypothetical protein
MSVKSLKKILKIYEAFLPRAIISLGRLPFVDLSQLDEGEQGLLVRYCAGKIDPSVFICVSYWEGGSKSWTIHSVRESSFEHLASQMSEEKGSDAYEILLIDSAGIVFDLKAEVKRVVYKLERRGS